MKIQKKLLYKITIIIIIAIKIHNNNNNSSYNSNNNSQAKKTRKIMMEIHLLQMSLKENNKLELRREMQIEFYMKEIYMFS